MGRGLPYAISSLLHYLILLLGFPVAIGAMGVDLNRVTLLTGAFGVGVGFGLQTIVNNFVSGVILLVERPIQVGDAIQMTDLDGEVRRIGIRSTTVHTWRGAEVIVPNATLISGNLINWTLSDRTRRLELPVGVAYGSDPERVIDLLVETAAHGSGSPGEASARSSSSWASATARSTSSSGHGPSTSRSGRPSTATWRSP